MRPSSETTPPTKWYIDVRPHDTRDHDVFFTIRTPPTPNELPLLSALRPSDQENVQRFHRLADRSMSLASALLKYLFIHRSAKIPWSEVVISRTPNPHRRPYWQAPSASASDAGNRHDQLEFNVSHQAGLVALIGCKTTSIASSPQAPQNQIPHQNPHLDIRGPVLSGVLPSGPRLGIDITCTHEPGRRQQPVTSDAEFAEWVDMHAEAFSSRELRDMKSAPIPIPIPIPIARTQPAARKDGPEPAPSMLQAKMRRFYAYWALKEAYIKMVGEGLLAPWLKELEFTNLLAPEPVSSDPEEPWGPVETGFETWLHGRGVDDVRMELQAYGETYIVATAMKGLQGFDQGRTDRATDMRKLDIEEDVRPCAEGTCECLADG